MHHGSTSERDTSIVELLRDRIVAFAAKKYWRSLEELADTPEFREFVEREYPQHAEEWDDPVERRTFLKLMGASLALAGLSGCVFQPPEKIVPYVKQPEDGTSRQSSLLCDRGDTGRCRHAACWPEATKDGRRRSKGIRIIPTAAIADPADRGSSATDIFSQASILALYDPDRSQTPLFREEIRTWTTFVGEMRTALDEQRPKQGAGLRFLTETITSPTLAAQLKGNSDRVSAGEVASVRTGQPRQRARRRDAWPSANRSTRSTTSASRTNSFARCDFPCGASGNVAVRARLCRAATSYRRARRR